jgi:hypothetical protein
VNPHSEGYLLLLLDETVNVSTVSIVGSFLQGDSLSSGLVVRVLKDVDYDKVKGSVTSHGVTCEGLEVDSPYGGDYICNQAGSAIHISKILDADSEEERTDSDGFGLLDVAVYGSQACVLPEFNWHISYNDEDAFKVSSSQNMTVDGFYSSELYSMNIVPVIYEDR